MTLDLFALADDIPRFSRQAGAILERLKQGPATNTELFEIAQRFGARIHELRKLGYVVSVKRVKPGVNAYSLEGGKR